MITLAIKGHKTRGREVIALLDMLGGHQCGYPKEAKTGYWFIDRCNNIVAYDTAPTDLYDDFTIFTLEEFEAKFPYKVGDKVISFKGIGIITEMNWLSVDKEVRYRLSIKNDIDRWFYAKDLQPYKTLQKNIDESFEQTNKVISETQAQCCDIRKSIIDKEQKTMEIKPNQIKDKNAFVDISNAEYNDVDTIELLCSGKFEIEIMHEYKIVLKRKKPKYPNSYNECCDALKIPNDERYIDIDVPLDYNKLLSALTELYICRNAYWKIAGEQMGLDESWKPDWDDDEWPDMYYISFDGKHLQKEKGYPCCNIILIFPTAEMRDAFYENFKELIEQCKELL